MTRRPTPASSRAATSASRTTATRDVIDFRNVRVLPLDEGSVQGPVTVEGDGEHTVEYRSTDVAGNEEEVKEVTFTIGEADETPPVTTHELDPEDPGAGGTYRGPVDVTLSATDPDEGGSEPATHDVNAQGVQLGPRTTSTPRPVTSCAGTSRRTPRRSRTTCGCSSPATRRTRPGPRSPAGPSRRAARRSRATLEETGHVDLRVQAPLGRQRRAAGRAWSARSTWPPAAAPGAKAPASTSRSTA